MDGVTIIDVWGKDGWVDINAYSTVEVQGGVKQDHSSTFYIMLAQDTANTSEINSVISLSTQARDEANAAKSAANTAAINAQNAYNKAEEARARAADAANNTWDETESKSAATLAKEARDKANQALTAITNLQNSMVPVILRISGYNGATCTTGSTFNVVVQAPGATEFRVKADTGSWSAWTPVSGYATATGITGNGAHTIFVEVRNAAGATASGQMTMFKL
ncbi:hypothetical protein SAMN02745218_01174 [Desulfofundulus australicus DSM 11792]|uniref:Uncharacterized protein n=1 Tax=Desulfofundulus australicus DSM 11792 TaxID=1121425 RepID=A0A1M4XUW6_9FIRM|nr:hypothetical protein [Desulfofundulus australicus]SHE97083.1 hypothetical protein SAMN02745218_01174 [Desulfofundulus australicus DSM 11792]